MGRGRSEGCSCCWPLRARSLTCWRGISEPSSAPGSLGEARRPHARVTGGGTRTVPGQRQEEEAGVPLPPLGSAPPPSCPAPSHRRGLRARVRNVTGESGGEAETPAGQSPPLPRDTGRGAAESASTQLREQGSPQPPPAEDAPSERGCPSAANSLQRQAPASAGSLLEPQISVGVAGPAGERGTGCNHPSPRLILCTRGRAPLSQLQRGGTAWSGPELAGGGRKETKVYCNTMLSQPFLPPDPGWRWDSGALPGAQPECPLRPPAGMGGNYRGAASASSKCWLQQRRPAGGSVRGAVQGAASGLTPLRSEGKGTGNLGGGGHTGRRRRAAADLDEGASGEVGWEAGGGHPGVHGRCGWLRC